MILIQTARFNGHDSYAYLKDVLTHSKQWGGGAHPIAYATTANGNFFLDLGDSNVGVWRPPLNLPT